MSDGQGQIRVAGLDHIVLRVTDIEAECRFFVDTLGLTPERIDEWRRNEVPFPSVRVDAGTIIDLFGTGDGATNEAERNLDHFCLVIEPTDLDALAERADLDVVDGPVDVFGARGMGTSVYVRSPNGVVVELRTYPS